VSKTLAIFARFMVDWEAIFFIQFSNFDSFLTLQPFDLQRPTVPHSKDLKLFRNTLFTYRTGNIFSLFPYFHSAYVIGVFIFFAKTVHTSEHVLYFLFEFNFVMGYANHYSFPSWLCSYFGKYWIYKTSSGQKKGQGWNKYVVHKLALTRPWLIVPCQVLTI